MADAPTAVIREAARDASRKIIVAGSKIEWPDAINPKLSHMGTVEAIFAQNRRSPDVLIVVDRLGAYHRVIASRANVIEDEPTGMDTSVYLDQDELRVIESALCAFRAEIKKVRLNDPKDFADMVYGDTDDLLRRIGRLDAKITNADIDLFRAHSS